MSKLILFTFAIVLIFLATVHADDSAEGMARNLNERASQTVKNQAAKAEQMYEQLKQKFNDLSQQLQNTVNSNAPKGNGGGWLSSLPFGGFRMPWNFFNSN
jgi:ABC-type transporter MlaC component